MSSPFLPKFSLGLAKLNAVHRLLMAVGFAFPAYVIFTWFGIKPVTGIMMSWDIFSLLLIIMIWVIIFNVPRNDMRALAQREDESRTVIFIIVLVSLLTSLFGIVLLLKNNNSNLINQHLHGVFSMSGVALSWILLHSVFTLHYAHLYYDEDAEKGSSIGGLDFPKEENPDYLDFAYFSFVIGMTFQVSDVSISERTIRHLALLHGIIAFLFNTIIVALTISIISNLNGK